MTFWTKTQAALGAAAVIVAVAIGSGGPARAETDAAASGAPAALEERGYALGDVVLGDENAPVTIIEYASLTCPHCSAFHADAYPEIKERYVDTGQVKFIVREVYFDRFGLWASMVSRCGGPDNFYAFIDVFLNTRAEWTSGDEAQIVSNIRRLGRLGGLSEERVDACLQDDELLNRLMADYRANASADGVQSTPTFIINGETARGNMPAAQMSDLIEAHLP